MKHFIFLLVFGMSLCTAQSYTYDILLVGSDVGDMTISRTVSGTKKTYKMESRTEVNYVIDSRKDIFSTTVVFENNVLISSKMENKKK